MKRRLYYGKVNPEDYYVVKDKFVVYVNKGGRGAFVVPKKCRFHLIIINETRQNWLTQLRNLVLGKLFSICEFLAHW